MTGFQSLPRPSKATDDCGGGDGARIELLDADLVVGERDRGRVVPASNDCPLRLRGPWPERPSNRTGDEGRGGGGRVVGGLLRSLRLAGDLCGVFAFGVDRLGETRRRAAPDDSFDALRRIGERRGENTLGVVGNRRAPDGDASLVADDPRRRRDLDLLGSLVVCAER